MTRNKSALRPTQTPHGCFTQANLRSAASTRRSVTARAGTKRRVHLVPECVVGKNMCTSAGREVGGLDNLPRLLYRSKQATSRAIAILLCPTYHLQWHTRAHKKHAHIHWGGTSERYEDGGSAHCWMLPSTSFHSYERRGWSPHGGLAGEGRCKCVCAHLPPREDQCRKFPLGDVVLWNVPNAGSEEPLFKKKMLWKTLGNDIFFQWEGWG